MREEKQLETTLGDLVTALYDEIDDLPMAPALKDALVGYMLNDLMDGKPQSGTRALVQ